LLFRKRIEKKRILERPPLRGAPLANPFDLSFRQRIGLCENAPDQRGLAVIDVADKNDFQPRWFGRHRFGGLEKSAGSQLLHRVRLMMILSAAGALARASALELGDDSFARGRVACDGMRNRMAA
jgi:hypothetical protein